MLSRIGGGGSEEEEEEEEESEEGALERFCSIACLCFSLSAAFMAICWETLASLLSLVDC